MLVDRGVFAEEAKFSVRNFKLTFNWIVLLLHWIQSVKSVQLSSDLLSKYVLISSTVFLVSVVSILHSETVSENKCGLKSVRRVIEPHTTINKSLAAPETVDSCSSSSEMLVEKVMFQHFYESNLCLMSAKLGLKFNERKSASTCWILLFFVPGVCPDKLSSIFLSITFVQTWKYFELFKNIFKRDKLFENPSWRIYHRRSTMITIWHEKW